VHSDGDLPESIMLVGTHALLPVCACLVADHISVNAGRGRVFPTSGLWAVGIFGVLPDLCSPHLSLESRQASWSHTVWFMAGLIVVVAVMTTFFEKGHRLRVALVCWISAGLHLVADAVSGGIAWLYPWRADVVGRYFIEPQHWIWFDAFFILLCWFLVRVLPHLEARQIRVSRSSNPDTIPP
jgi:hypothetical protein